MKSIALCHYVAHPHNCTHPAERSAAVLQTLLVGFCLNVLPSHGGWKKTDPGTMELSLMAAQVRTQKHAFKVTDYRC